MATLTAIAFNLAGSVGVFSATMVAFGCAVRSQNTFVAARCTARPPTVIHNPDPNRHPSQDRGNPTFGWIPWVMQLTYATMLAGVPGTGTRDGGLSGALLKVNLDGIVLLRFHHLCLRVCTLATFLYLLVVLPLYATAQCSKQTVFFEGDNQTDLQSVECQESNLTDYQRLTLANVPKLHLDDADDVLGDMLNWFSPIHNGDLARLYIVVLCGWIITYYALRELQVEWGDVLAMRRVYYLEADHWKDRMDELECTLLRVEREKIERRNSSQHTSANSSMVTDESYMTNRQPWIPHPEQRDTVPNIELYSVLVGGLPTLPTEVVDRDEEAVFSRKQSIDWQLSVTTAFFDHCVPNQPGFSSSIAAVTILPSAQQLTEAWNHWYRVAGRLRRLRFIRREIAARKKAMRLESGQPEVSDVEAPCPREQPRDLHQPKEKNQSVYGQTEEKKQYYQEVLGSTDDLEVENNLLFALDFGPEQTATYSREFALGAANLAPHGWHERRVKSASLQELYAMEKKAAEQVHEAHAALREAQERIAEDSEDESVDDLSEDEFHAIMRHASTQAKGSVLVPDTVPVDGKAGYQNDKGVVRKLSSSRHSNPSSANRSAHKASYHSSNISNDFSTDENDSFYEETSSDSSYRVGLKDDNNLKQCNIDRSQHKSPTGESERVKRISLLNDVSKSVLKMTGLVRQNSSGSLETPRRKPQKARMASAQLPSDLGLEAGLWMERKKLSSQGPRGSRAQQRSRTLSASMHESRRNSMDRAIPQRAKSQSDDPDVHADDLESPVATPSAPIRRAISSDAFHPTLEIDEASEPSIPPAVLFGAGSNPAWRRGSDHGGQHFASTMLNPSWRQNPELGGTGMQNANGDFTPARVALSENDEFSEPSFPPPASNPAWRRGSNHGGQKNNTTMVNPSWRYTPDPGMPEMQNSSGKWRPTTATDNGLRPNDISAEEFRDGANDEKDQAAGQESAIDSIWARLEKDQQRKMKLREKLSNMQDEDKKAAEYAPISKRSSHSRMDPLERLNRMYGDEDLDQFPESQHSKGQEGYRPESSSNGVSSAEGMTKGEAHDSSVVQDAPFKGRTRIREYRSDLTKKMSRRTLSLDPTLPKSNQETKEPRPRLINQSRSQRSLSRSRRRLAAHQSESNDDDSVNADDIMAAAKAFGGQLPQIEGSVSSHQADDNLRIAMVFEEKAGLRRRESIVAKESKENLFIPEDKWSQVTAIVQETSRDKNVHMETKERMISSGSWKTPTFASIVHKIKKSISSAWALLKFRLKPPELVDDLVRDSSYAVVTFTSRQAAVAARHCLADSRGRDRWVTVSDIPSPPLADAPACNMSGFRGCVRPVTLSLSDKQKIIRHNLALAALVTIYFFYTIPLTAAQELVSPERLSRIFPDIQQLQESSVFLSNLFSGFIPALVWTAFFAFCPPMFKIIANFGSNATSSVTAENCALQYFWWFMLVSAFTGTSFSTAFTGSFTEGWNLGSEIRGVIEDTAATIPPKVSATWLNWMIVRVFAVLPTQYLLQLNTFIFSGLGLKCCARTVRGGGAGGPVPYRIYVDSGVVMLCLFALAPASPLIAPAAFAYFLFCTPLLRWTMIFLYKPKFDMGGGRFPFIFDICVSGMVTGQILLMVMMSLKSAIGPAIAAFFATVPTIWFRYFVRRRYLRAFNDAALLQTSLLDGWDTNEETSEQKREDFRRFLVDCHKAAYVPVCIAGDVTTTITAEPAVVVPLEHEFDEDLEAALEEPMGDDTAKREEAPTFRTDHVTARAQHQPGAMVRRASTLQMGNGQMGAMMRRASTMAKQQAGLSRRLSLPKYGGGSSSPQRQQAGLSRRLSLPKYSGQMSPKRGAGGYSSNNTSNLPMSPIL